METTAIILIFLGKTPASFLETNEEEIKDFKN